MTGKSPEITPELAVLGSCIADPGALQFVFHAVEEDHFFEARNRALFQAIKRMNRQGIDLDPVTIDGNLLPEEKRLIDIHFLLDVCDKVPTALHVRHYARLMRNRWISKELEQRYEKLKLDPLDSESQSEVKKLWDSLNNDSSPISSIKEASTRYTETLEARRNNQFESLSFGFPNLDEMVGGLSRGNMVVFGARTSVGKTSLLLNIAINFIRQSVKLLFVSAEMTWDELLDRMVSVTSRVFVSKLRKGSIQSDEMTKVVSALGEMADLPMWCLEGGRMSMSRLRMAIETINPTVVIVDFIQRFTPPHSHQSRAAYFSDLSNDMKSLAMEKKIVVIVASQLNREIEKSNEEREPSLSDLKESGGLEESADVAILLSGKRTEDPLSRKKDVSFYVKKNRNGPTGMVPFEFEKSITRFEEKKEEGFGNPEREGSEILFGSERAARAFE